MWSSIEFFFGVVFDLPYVLQMVVVAFTTVLLLGTPFGEKLKPFRMLLHMVLLCMFYIAVALGCVQLSNYWLWLRGMDTVIMYLLGTALYALVAGAHDRLCNVTMSAIIFSMSVVIAYLGGYIGESLIKLGIPVNIAYTKEFSYLLALPPAILFYKWPIYEYKASKADAGIIIATSFSFSFLTILYDVMRLNGLVDSKTHNTVVLYVLNVVIFLYCLEILSYFMIYTICKNRERVLNYQVEQQKKERLQELVRLSDYKLSELYEVKHEVKNQYSYMQVLLKEQRYQELDEYFNQVLGTFAKPLFDSVSTGNTVVDSILNMEMAKANDAGVKLDCKVTVPAVLPIKESSLLSIFTNIIDNAIEACVNEGIADAVIEVVLNIKGDYLLFSVANPTKKTEVDPNYVTSKKNKIAHGYGIKIVKKLVKHYNGFYRCFIENGKFISESLLDLQYKNAK